MFEIVWNLLGKFTYEFFLLSSNFLQTALCALLCSWSRKRRPLFALRLTLCVITGILLCIPVAMLNTNVPTNAEIPVRVLCYLLVSGMAFGLLAICYEERPVELLFCWCSGVAYQQISTRFYQLVQNLCGINDKTSLGFFSANLSWIDWLIYFAYYAAVYFLCFLIFRKRDRLELDRETAINVATMSAITVLLVNGLVCVARVYEEESMALNIILKIFCILFGVIILFVCAGMLSQSKTRRDMNVIKYMWKQEQLQFEHAKANIDVINAKCHDLKHMFARLENKLNRTEIEELKEAVEFYDRNIKTDNEILDVILCEKSMVCARDDIRLTCLADGKLLSFLSPAQTYSLFGNMLDNAIEAVRRLEDKEKRIISLTVRESENGIEIESVNYCSEGQGKKRSPQETSKPDRNKHGYGIKNMKYIAEQYGGTLSIMEDSRTFTLHIDLPTPIDPAADKTEGI